MVLGEGEQVEFERLLCVEDRKADLCGRIGFAFGVVEVAQAKLILSREVVVDAGGQASKLVGAAAPIR